MAVPEKYLTPSSGLAVHGSSLASWSLAGAPRFGGKLTSHGPFSVARVVLVGRGSVRDGDAAARRKTTNSDSRSAKCNGTVVWPFAMAYSAGSMAPVSGCQSSACLPLTRKRASTSWAASVRLATK